LSRPEGGVKGGGGERQVHGAKNFVHFRCTRVFDGGTREMAKRCSSALLLGKRKEGDRKAKGDRFVHFVDPGTPAGAGGAVKGGNRWMERHYKQREVSVSPFPREKKESRGAVYKTSFWKFPGSPGHDVEGERSDSITETSHYRNKKKKKKRLWKEETTQMDIPQVVLKNHFYTGEKGNENRRRNEFGEAAQRGTVRWGNPSSIEKKSVTDQGGMGRESY